MALPAATRADPPADQPILGFSPAHATAEHALEASFDRSLDPATERAWLQQMASAPNQVGSPHDKANAEFMLAQFRAWGWDAAIESFSILYPTPKRLLLEMVSPTKMTAEAQEPALKEDASTQHLAGALPPFTIYGPDGDVTAEAVYVNRGMPEDYDELARHGVSVSGRIVIARYGGGWRGLKPKLAAEHGAVGCVLYSDPADDGYAAGVPYPQGGMRPPAGVQRGSLLDLENGQGDPLTPGYAAIEGAKRVALKDAKGLAKIPTLPISYADARPILDALTGDVAPPNWRGALPVTYRMGPGPAKLHLVVEQNWTQATLYDVVARIQGSEFPDEWVMRGNHHDGWVFGAWDPLSANVAMLDEAKALGALLRTGWRPKRTIVYLGWDAEEPGLIGSEEWIELHQAELTQRGMLYLNTDLTGRGFFEALGSPTLRALVNGALRDVKDPETGTSVLERAKARLLVEAAGHGASDEARAAAKSVTAGGSLPLEPLGSGSDFAGFVHHLGIPSTYTEFGGEDEQSGVYHSAYDTFEHYVRFGDPAFTYSPVLAAVNGRMVLRAADADILPFGPGDLADAASRYTAEVKALADTRRQAAEQRNALLDRGAYTLAADQRITSAPPPRLPVVPKFDFTPLDAALITLKASTAAYDVALAGSGGRLDGLPKAKRQAVDAALHAADLALLSPDGLPGRPWYRSLLSASGKFTGYGAKTLPGIREAIEEDRPDDAVAYISRTAAAFTAYAQALDAATAALKGS